MKAFILARVSSKEQEENNKQEDELTPFEKNLEIYQALQSFL